MAESITVGSKLKITQQITQREETWTTTAIGVVQEYTQKKTGVHFAHSKGNHLWLDRVMLKTEDGELVEINLDNNSIVEILATPESTQA